MENSVDNVRDIRFAEYSEEQAIKSLNTSIDEALDRDTVDEMGNDIYDTVQILVSGKVHAFKLDGVTATAMIEFMKRLCDLNGHKYPWPER